MSPDDPHIHVEAEVARHRAQVRNVVASAFGVVGDLPSRVATGCGLAAVPYAMTSARPEQVTCLPCREHARAQHLRFAEMVERMSRMPGSTISSDQGKRAADVHRDLADRFSDT